MEVSAGQAYHQYSLLSDLRQPYLSSASFDFYRNADDDVPRIFSLDNVSVVGSVIYDRPPAFLDINITAELYRNANFNCNGTCSSNWTFDEMEEEGEHNWLFLLLVLLVVGGGLGNVLVCLAICLEKRLQNVTNCFLLSLAVADLLVCVAVMPFGIVEGFLGYWPFEWGLCLVWVCCDVLSCSASIMHMCAISLGRYLGIRSPLASRAHSRRRGMLARIAASWLLAVVIAAPVAVLAVIDPSNVQPARNACAINNKFFFVFGSMFAFYIPMVIMVVTYVLTVRLLRRKAKFLAEKPPPRRAPFVRRGPSLRSPSDRANGHCSHCSGGPSRGCDEPSFASFRGATRIDRHCASSFSRGGMVRTLGSSNQVANEQKATKVLGIVFFCFAVCWTPFFILNGLFAAVGPEHFSPVLSQAFLWLGYGSSTINPLIYTVFNRHFKSAFWRLLTCRCQPPPVGLNGPGGGGGDAWAFRSTKSTSPPGNQDPCQESTVC